MQTNTSNGLPARIALRTREFGVFCKMKGWETIAQQAKEIGVNEATVSRVVRGETAPGERFIAGVLAAFPEAIFSDLFEVTTEDVAVAS
ncbi:MAG: helix-turn-helix transcriptional regulator [Candidatus Nanopelagicales bacterium]